MVRRLFGILFLLFALLIFASSAASLFRAARLTMGGVVTDGNVTGNSFSDWNGGRGSPLRRPVVKFTIQAVDYHFTENAGTWTERSDLNGVVPVVYMPSNPEIASINFFWYIWYDGLARLLVALAFGIPGFMIARPSHNAT